MIGFFQRLRNLSAHEEPDELFVIYDNQNYIVKLRRSANAKRLTLRFNSAAGHAVVTSPYRPTLKSIQAFIDKNAGWIANRYEKRPKAQPFMDGGTFLLRGQEVQIQHLPETRGTTCLEGQILYVMGDKIGLPRRVKHFLLKEAKNDLTQATLKYASQLGVSVKGIVLKDTSTRWGSCSSAGNINYSWRLICAPPFVLDYICAHEVAHRQEMNHSPKYWRVLASLNSDKLAAHAWLKKHGQSLHLVGKD